MSTKDYEIAGQLAPATDADGQLYLVPANTQFVASTITMCNTGVGTSVAKYRIAVVKSGETLSAKHYIRYDKFLVPGRDDKLTLGITLSAGDKVMVRSNTGLVSFSLFGCKIS
jgi:hypothetical protein